MNNWISVAKTVGTDFVNSLVHNRRFMFFMGMFIPPYTLNQFRDFPVDVQSTIIVAFVFTWIFEGRPKI